MIIFTIKKKKKKFKNEKMYRQVRDAELHNR
jgi:hypothetical protein